MLWRALDGSPIDQPARVAIKLLFAPGGQRVREILGMRWTELDLTNAQWSLPPARTKNAKAHVVPLSKLALSLLEEITPLAGPDLLFPGYRNAAEPMRSRSIAQAVDRFCAKSGFEKFSPRDIRRTVKTRMGEIGIDKGIRDRLQNHAFHDVSSKHYDRYGYLAEKRCAMDRWTDWLRGTIAGVN